MKDTIKNVEDRLAEAEAAAIKRDLNKVVGSLTESVRELLEVVKTLATKTKAAPKKKPMKTQAAKAPRKQSTPIKLDK